MVPMTTRLIWMAAAGAVGTLSRYGLAVLVQKWTDHPFPWGTLTVNSLGCLLFGIVWVLAAEKQILDKETQMIILIGFMGAFTTFSTFAFESTQMIHDGRWLFVTGNILAQNILGLACVYAGAALGRLF